jgi:glycosyltransferase involved in cell wall biosynthesis
MGYEPRKNLARVIEAYAGIRRDLRDECSLVLICSKQEVRVALSQELSRKGLGAIVVGNLADSDLRWLYGLAQVFVFPSLQEGFGLPPLEALTCGTPVITSNTSSLPEVVGDAALLVPPTEVKAIVDALTQVLTSSTLADELRARGLERSKMFTWERTARETLAVYEQVAVSKPGSSQSGV